MRRLSFTLLIALAAGPAMTRAASCDCGHVSCTGAGGCPECVPACKATWDEKTTNKPKYSITCEHACTRGFDSWHAPPPECRCSPPCGDVIVRKRLYKADGEEKMTRKAWAMKEPETDQSDSEGVLLNATSSRRIPSFTMP